jgi:hypothetical protein
VSDGFPGQAYLDQLRPDPGWSVRYAYLTAYSADPIVIGAALLALAGRSNEAGSGSAADFAESLELLRGRMRLIIQRGRLQRPPDLPRISGVLDQFLVEREFDEAERSWHPKLALVAYAGPRGARSWRLWIGSRNLTRSRDLDLGLLIETVSKRKKGAGPVPGVAALGRSLAHLAHLADFREESVERELSGLLWSPPEDVRLQAIRLGEGNGVQASPLPPGEIESFIVVSPFLCDAFVGQMAAWGGKETERTLVTTFNAVRALGTDAKRKLSPFQLLALAPAQSEEEAMSSAAAKQALTKGAPSNAVDPTIGEEGSEDSEVPPVGLHAKLFAFRQRSALRVVMGSANATDRAWSGRNVEAVAQFEGGPAIKAGLEALVGPAMPIPVELLDEPAPEETDAAERIDRCRAALAARWSISMKRSDESFRLEAETGPPLGRNGIRLEVGLATGDLQPWPRGAQLLDLGNVPLALQTDLIELKLTLGEECARWLQRVSVTPPIVAERDRAAIGRFLGARAFQAWMRGILEGESGAGDDTPWERHDRDGAGGQRDWNALEDLTLEDILGAWARDESAFRRADKRFDGYVAAVLDHDDTLIPQERRGLEQLRGIWATARQVLLT